MSLFRVLHPTTSWSQYRRACCDGQGHPTGRFKHFSRAAVYGFSGSISEMLRTLLLRTIVLLSTTVRGRCIGLHAGPGAFSYTA